MKRKYLFAWAGVLTVCLATWAALLGAQPGKHSGPAEDTPPPGGRA
jgi:hypothetical protein